jgi:soluble lytic murein transglycosylase
MAYAAATHRPELLLLALLPPVVALMSVTHAWADAAADTLSAQRERFKIVDQALERGDAAPFEAEKADLAQYPLYPYLLYRFLLQRVQAYPAAQVRDFLATYDRSPLANRLRKAWLARMAEEHRWADVLRDYRPGNDTALNCYQRQALLHTGQRREALQGIEEIWMHGRSLPDACDPLFRLWRDQGGPSREAIWKRFRLALAADEVRLARYLRGQLSAEDQARADLWFTVHNDPGLTLDATQLDPEDPDAPAIVLHGLGRWSREDSVSAAAALDILKKRYAFPEAPLAELERTLALFVASRGHPSALVRLNALAPAMVDEAVQAWRVRTGLTGGDWQTALRGLEQMSPELADRPQWRYWRARALEQTGRSQEVERAYRALAGKRDYYGFLAADRLKIPYQLHDTPIAIDEATMRALLTRLPGLQRSRELFLLQRRWEARLEWRDATRALAQSDLRTAAKLAHGWGWHWAAIAALVQADDWDDLALRFPTPYRDRVLASARENHVDPAWVYAIMRQESAFQPDIRSSAGALGLMQIMPATGRRVAQRLQFTLPNDYALLNTGTNIRLGAAYLSHALDRLQHNALLATAAYNAGPHRVSQWLPEDARMDADVWAETIPFHETRKYVKRVMEYTVIYQQRLQRDDASLQAQMPPILPALD